MPVDELAGIAQINLLLTRQDAEGTVSIGSSNPEAQPVIDYSDITCDADMARLADGWNFCRELIQHPAFAKHGARALSDRCAPKEIVRQNVIPGLHAMGTCQMGRAEDPAAVVDSRLAVHGVPNLMVADASVFPEDVLFNINLTCHVVGEIAAEVLRNGPRHGREGSDGPRANSDASALEGCASEQ
jgi:choline dehydrogenase